LFLLQLEADQVRLERKGDKDVAALTMSSTAPSRELVEEVAEAAGKVVAKVVEKELHETHEKALATRHGARGEAQEEEGEGREMSATGDASAAALVGAEKERMAKSRDRLLHKAAREREMREKMARAHVLAEEYKKPARSISRKKEVREEGAREREETSNQREAMTRVTRHIVQAVPVKTVVAVVDGVGDGEGQGGHPALRATATPLVITQALKVLEKEAGLSDQGLYSKAVGHPVDRHGDLLKDRRAGAEPRSQEALGKDWASLAAVAANRKADAEGAQMLPSSSQGRKRAGSRYAFGEPLKKVLFRRPTSQHLKALPQSLAPHTLSQRQIDERDDVVGTKWNAENGLKF
jgi:hypothetical protein